jgi:hypothetical protein
LWAPPYWYEPNWGWPSYDYYGPYGGATYGSPYGYGDSTYNDYYPDSYAYPDSGANFDNDSAGMMPVNSVEAAPATDADSPTAAVQTAP